MTQPGKRCGEHPTQAEFTICGDAFDAYGSGDSENEIIFARPGDTITCDECRDVIDGFKAIKRYKQP